MSRKASDRRFSIGAGRLALVVIASLAMALVGATSAFAKENPTKEKAEWRSFENCPFGEHAAGGGEVQGCQWAQSAYKEKWQSNKQKAEWEEKNGPTPNQLSHFTAGNVNVALKLPITLRTGFAENEESGELEIVAAKGADTIQPVAQAGPPLKTTVDTSKLSESELDRYNYYTKVAKETKTKETIEMAGPVSNLTVNLGNLLNETGVAFQFPVKVKLSNGFYGNECYVGSEEDPIIVDMTTGSSGELKGKAGAFTFNGEGTMLTLWGDTLVASGFEVPAVNGCGTAGGADEALDSALGLPSSSNTAVLNGVLKQAGSEPAEEHLGLKPKE